MIYRLMFVRPDNIRMVQYGEQNIHSRPHFMPEYLTDPDKCTYHRTLDTVVIAINRCPHECKIQFKIPTSDQWFFYKKSDIKSLVQELTLL